MGLKGGMTLLRRAGSFHSPAVPYQQTNPDEVVSYLGYSIPALFTPASLPPYFLLLPSLLLPTSLLTPPSLSFCISFS